MERINHPLSFRVSDEDLGYRRLRREFDSEKPLGLHSTLADGVTPEDLEKAGFRRID